MHEYGDFKPIEYLVWPSLMPDEQVFNDIPTIDLTDEAISGDLGYNDSMKSSRLCTEHLPYSIPRYCRPIDQDIRNLE